jgi:hypothetical protein
MDKRTLLALFLILIVFWISSEFIWKKNIPQQTTVQPLENTEQTTIPPQTDSTQNTGLLSEGNEVVTPIEITQTDIEIVDNIVLQNDLITLKFSNLGAVITAIELTD